MSIWKSLLCLAGVLIVDPAAYAEPTTTKVRIAGLFSPDREKDLRELFEEWPEVKLVRVDFARSEAELSFDSEKLYPKAKPADVIARLNDQLRKLSNYTFGVKPLCAVPWDKLTRVEIAIAGLDCKACCLAAYEMVAKIDGVEAATASFRDGRLTATIDPAKTTKAKLEAVLKERGVLK